PSTVQRFDSSTLQPAATSLLTARPCIEGVKLAFASTPGRTYAVSLLDRPLQPSIMLEVLATGATTTVRVPCAGADAGLVQIREVSSSTTGPSSSGGAWDS